MHTDSVWALASTPTFSHVYSGGRDLSVSILFSINLAGRISFYSGYLIRLFALMANHLFSFCLFFQLYLTDLATRDSLLLCTGEHPIQKLALHDDSLWIATADSSVNKWPAEGHNPQKNFQRGGATFLAGNLSFSRARSLEGSNPVCFILCSRLI